MRLSILCPFLYAVAAGVLLNLPLKKWYALHIFYAISWPASHLLAKESLMVQIFFGVIQWVVLGLLSDLILRSQNKE